MLPDCLCHYYDSAQGPFRNLSSLPVNRAEDVLEAIRQRGTGFASQRSSDYLTIRRELEARIRSLFINKGGRPERAHPHYMILGQCAWVKSWYVNGRELCVPLTKFRPECVSFTYGDTFPAMRYEDGKPYRGQVFTLAELPELVRQFGLPQAWNADGSRGPDRYIEAQVWEDQALQKWLSVNKKDDSRGAAL